MVEQYIKDNHIQIVGLSGRAGIGKDFVAENVFKKLIGYQNISFAWHMKIDCLARGLGDYEEVFITKPKRVRRLLQVLGTEQGRDMWGKDIWIDATFAWILLFHRNWGMDKFVIPDCRFINELEAIQRVGGKVYRIIGNRARSLTKEAGRHSSETELTDTDNIYDGQIVNSSIHKVDMLHDQILTLQKEI